MTGEVIVPPRDPDDDRVPLREMGGCRVDAGSAWRALVPAEIQLPAEFSDATITVALVVQEDPVRVVSPGLDELGPVLARGSVDLVKHYCALWDRWLARVESQVAS